MGFRNFGSIADAGGWGSLHGIQAKTNVEEHESRLQGDSRRVALTLHPFRGVPSDGLRRHGLSILKTEGKSEAEMPLKQGSNALVTKLPFQ